MIESSSLHLLTESDEIGRVLQVPFLVSPESSSCSNSGLNFIDDQVDAVFLQESEYEYQSFVAKKVKIGKEESKNYSHE